MKTQITERLALMRTEMKTRGIDAAIIPQTDPHQSEYLADHWQVRRYLSGFTGSAGSLVVTSDNALLWTDSRYFLQAAAQLEDTGIQLMKDGLPETPSIADYLTSTLTEGSTVGIDGMLFSITDTAALRASLAAKGIGLDVEFDVADAIWPDRPALPDSPVFIHELRFAGLDAAAKIDAVLAATAAANADAVFISALDEIAWTLNIRSSDVECSPVATSFLYLAPDRRILFISEPKLTPAVREHLSDAGVEVRPYETAKEFLASAESAARVLLPTAQSAGALLPVLGERAVTGDSVVAVLKGCKNETQIAGTRNAMVRDGVALVKAIMEIERTIADGGKLDEITVADILEKYRSCQEYFFDLSFGTIAGWGEHGAIVHYSATPSTNATIDGNNLLLIDSGANYLDGTTDITRTIAVGTPTDRQRHDFTLVMKGHIALATAVFPEGTRGSQLDALARQFLWKEGLSYLHGTGHGVGHFLNVHEGPQNIRLNENPATLRPGMITSNEPGLYRAGEYGIRCENLTLVVPAMTTEFGRFYRFETLTLFPFDLTLFDTSIMTDDEIEWLNDYHAEVRRRLSPCLDEAERAWLDAHTVKLTR